MPSLLIFLSMLAAGRHGIISLVKQDVAEASYLGLNETGDQDNRCGVQVFVRR
jgi:hypothetical protein